MKKWIVAILTIVCIVYIIYQSSIIGVIANNVEKDAREAAKIDDSWVMESYSQDDVVAMIFYPEDFSDSRLAIYSENEGLSFGLFFQEGGTHNTIPKECIAAREFGNQIVYYSWHSDVAYAEIEDEDNIQIVEFDGTAPFVYIQSKEVKVIFYDSQDNVIPTY